MPTYQYACMNADCGNQFDLVQSFSDPAASACPVCGDPVRKVYGSVGVVFKGSGFYRTDSRAGDKSTAKAKAKADSSSASSSESSSTTSSSSSTSGSSATTSAPAQAASA